MKKQYFNPELTVIAMKNSDIVTISSVEVKGTYGDGMSDLAPTRSWEGDF